MRRELGIRRPRSQMWTGDRLQKLRRHAGSSSANWADGGPNADTCSAAGWLSFRRIVDIPFGVCLAAIESWQHTGQDGNLHLGQSVLHGPVERDPDSGTCQIQVRLARRPLRPPLLMRLDIDRLSAARTALELIPGKRVRPTAGYFRAGHRLLDSLTHALLVCARNAQYYVSQAAPSRCPAAAGRAGSTSARPTSGCCQPGSTGPPRRPDRGPRQRARPGGTR
jgi:hypothetical protein